MDFIMNIKLIAEIITSVATAGIIFLNFFKHLPKPVKLFFTKTIPLFFKGFHNPNGKKDRFFKAVESYRKYNETNKNILKALLPCSKTEDILIIDKEALLDYLSKSGIVHSMTQK